MLMMEYNPSGRLGSIGAEVKFIWAIGLSIGILFCHLAIVQLAVALALTSLLVMCGVRAAFLIGYAKIFWPIFTLIFLIHLFYHPGNILFQIWFLKATEMGMKAGIFNLVRFVNFNLIAIGSIYSISPVEFSRKLSWFLGALRWQRLSELALIFFIALRFMPVLTREVDSVKMAMVARGANFHSGIRRRTRMNLRILLPIFSRVIRQSDDVASAIALKSNRGNYFIGQRPALRLSDIALIIVGLMVTTAIIFV